MHLIILKGIHVVHVVALVVVVPHVVVCIHAHAITSSLIHGVGVGIREPWPIVLIAILIGRPS